MGAEGKQGNTQCLGCSSETSRMVRSGGISSE